MGEHMLIGLILLLPYAGAAIFLALYPRARP